MLNNFRFLTSGESHGKCLNGIIDGIPAGFEIDFEFINNELKRRQSGWGRGERMQIETDEVEIKSGVRFGKTTGAPICLEIKNNDFENWQKIMSVEKIETYTDEKSFTKPRPGHADFAGSIKYDIKDLRDILERSSARKTAMDVAIGAIAKQILLEFNIDCTSKVQIAGESEDDKIKEKIEHAKEQGETLGGSLEVIFKNLPVGLGSHVQWDRKLDGLIAQAVMSIPAVKAVEIGLGVKSAEVLGSQMHDEIFIDNGKYYRKTNNAGGLEGGMTNGEDLVVRATMKPIPTLKKPLCTVDLKDNSQTQAHFERSDTCAVSACAVIAEAMIACVLVDVFLDKFGKDNISEIKNNYSNRK
ncbi:MAG: chorismate synthase [Candidatus Gastranaerophilales bacterium]|nr:chorismate synthase [Candidatus Gastranaerophilales bacterium]